MQYDPAQKYMGNFKDALLASNLNKNPRNNDGFLK